MKINANETSSKRADIIAETERHFRKVQTAAVSNAPDRVSDFPWEKGPNPMKLRKAGNQTPLMEEYDEELYMEHLRMLPGRKAPGPDGITNEILKMMPQSFHVTVAEFMRQIGMLGKTPNSWKVSNTILL